MGRSRVQCSCRIFDSSQRGERCIEKFFELCESAAEQTGSLIRIGGI